jgi:hypothetical protein
MHPIQLIPGGLLLTDQLVEGLGIGEDALAIGRQEDHLHPIKFGIQLVYETDEILAWIRKTGRLAKAPTANYRRETYGRKQAG